MHNLIDVIIIVVVDNRCIIDVLINIELLYTYIPLVLGSHISGIPNVNY